MSITEKKAMHKEKPWMIYNRLTLMSIWNMKLMSSQI